MINETVTYSAAFIAGIFSFFSPCVLPLLPAYFTFITGFTLEELTESHNLKIKKKVFLSTLSFVAGFSFIFILLGASASFIGGLALQYKTPIRITGGILILIFGIYLTGLIKIKSLDFEKRIHLVKKPLHFFGTFLIGMAFGAGWTPCIGPLLGSILIIASNQETVSHGVILLCIFSTGLALPFIVLSFFINYILDFLKKATKILKYVNITAGALLILVGLILIFKY